MMHGLAGLDKGIIEGLFDTIDRTSGGTGIGEGCDELCALPLTDEILQDRLKRVSICHPVNIGHKARIGREVWYAQHLAEDLELTVIADCNHHRSVGGVKDLIGHHRWVAIAHTAGRLAGDEIARSLIGQHGELCVEQGTVDMLPLPRLLGMAKGHQDADGRIETGRQVRDRNAGLDRRPIGLACDAHHPAHGLSDKVIAGPVGIGTILTKARDRAIDQARIDRRQGLIVEAVTLQPANLEVLNDNIGLRRQFADQVRPLEIGKIYGQRPLIAVGRQVIGALARHRLARVQRGDGRTPGAGIVPPARRLNLDHIGPEIGEDLGAPRPCQHP